MTKIRNNKKGILLPPAIGYSLRIIVGLIKKNKIQIKYFPKLFVILIVNLINLPFRTYERFFINPKYQKKTIKKAPIFILGHWRSGTTHLHNLLCQDPQMAYVTTYQSVFPDTLFNKLGRFLFLGFSKLLIPSTRKGDNVSLGASLPQEEEFALGDKTPISFYFFWLFPKNMLHYYDEYIGFKNIDIVRLEKWKSNYKLLIHKAIKNTKKERFLSKNPPNTGRINILLDMYPNAKFIYIHRNPVEVFLSTQNFYKKMLPPLQLQDISKKEIEFNIIEIYKKIMNDYLEQKKLVPEGNLVEVAYEHLEKDPTEVLKNIYDTIDLDGYKEAAPNFENYINNLKNYKKNKHIISKKQLDILMKEWGFAMEKYNNISSNIEVKSELI